MAGGGVGRERKGIQQSNGSEYNHNTLYICMYVRECIEDGACVYKYECVCVKVCV